MTRWLLCAAVLAGAACQRLQPTPAASATPAPDPLEEGKALLEQGQLDSALARLEGAPATADSLYYQGVVWLRRSETAPLPTPVPVAGDPRRVRVPEFKDEELKALELFDEAVAQDPRYGAAHLAAAELLAAHAVRRHEESAAAAPRRGRARPPETPPPVEGEPDLNADRILASYRAAADSDPSPQPVEALIRFAMRMGRLEDARSGYEELVRRDKENPEPLVRFGDFLVSQLKDRRGAIESYSQALIWRPDDEATRSKLADIYIGMGMEHYARKEWAAAQARFADAEKYISDRNSPQGLKVQDHQARLREIRRPSGR